MTLHNTTHAVHGTRIHVARAPRIHTPKSYADSVAKTSSPDLGHATATQDLHGVVAHKVAPWLASFLLQLRGIHGSMDVLYTHTHTWIRLLAKQWDAV